MKEIAKSHEDYLAMGGGELNSLIQRLQQEEHNANGFLSRTGAIVGIGAKARARKQRRIAESLLGLNNSGVMIQDTAAITALGQANNNNLTPMIDVLARIDAGHEFDTHFFTSTSRQNITTQRHKIMQELKAACVRSSLSYPDPNNNSTRITITTDSTPDQRALLRQELRTNQSYINQRNLLGQAYTQVQKDIISTRKTIAGKDMANYVAVTG